ncbi:MAG TPA: hypothetical protein VH333_15495 [Pseudonocardiaceae bacterium]|jgi:pimeloyl-ACP methyl ester carboxylesterase|nr:hypothetical protein [Pseudonocardiaceae bacterium]
MSKDNPVVTETVRADGPAMVVKGPDHGPVVVVLDPSGDAKHDELPATWRPIAEDIGVVWWRLPSARRASQKGGRLLADLPGGHDRVHLVGVHDAALLTLSLAVDHRDLVRSAVLVDPPWPEHDSSAVGRIVNDPGLVVREVRTDAAGDRLPIGHPDVVAAVVRELVSVDVEPPEHTTPTPGAGSLTQEALRALQTTLQRLTGASGRQP